MKFQPKADRPQWQTIYDQLATMDIGDIIEDPTLFGLLPDAPVASARSAFHRAVRAIEDDRKRTFARVRKVGYRMVEATEHEALARAQHRSAKRRMGSALRKIHSADRARLTDEDRRRFNRIEDHLTLQREMINRLEGRINKTDQRVADTEKDTAQLADRIDKLTDLLRRHDIVDGG